MLPKPDVTCSQRSSCGLLLPPRDAGFNAFTLLSLPASSNVSLFLATGSNLICTSIHKALTRLFDLHCKPGTQPYIEELFIQVDNCVGENKNHILIGYLGSLVGRGVVGRAEVDFMIVGHTHILIDQIFSR